MPALAAKLVVEPGSRATVDAESQPYRPYGACLDIFRRRDRELVIEGGADTGKSRACLEKLHACATKYAGMRGAIVRKTRKSLSTTAMQTFERFVCPPGAAKLWGGEEYRYANGSRLYLLGLDDPEKLKSLELDVAFVQECSELIQDDWEILSSRVTGRGSVMPYVQLLGDMNPREPNFWLYAREAAGTTAFLTAKHEDNPSVTPERLAALDALTGYRYQRLRLGLRVGAEGAYFDEWDPEVHTCEAFDPPADWPKWIGVDYGFAVPFCALWLARCPEDRRIYVYREIYAAGLRDEQQADLIRERSEGEVIQQLVLDPAMFNARSEQQRPSIAQVYALRGLQQMVAQGIFAGQNSRKQGWAIVRRVLAHDEGPPRLQVMRQRCPNLMRTLPSLVHDPLDPEDVADKIGGQKTEDHAGDCIRYACAAEAGPEAMALSIPLSWR